MEVDTAPETDIKMASPEKATEETTNAVEAIKSPVKEDAKPAAVEHKSKNGTLSGVAAAAAASAAAVAAKDKPPMAGVVVQFPEMFSMNRDGHILKKLESAADVKLQKVAFVECESEEAATALQAKLNNTTMRSKRVSASRLDTTEKNGLYLGALKKETTDDMLRALLPGIEEIKREKYNTFILFASETECRAARSKVIKEGIHGQMLHCDFDLRKDRFKPAEEPPTKKPKEDEESTKETKEAETKEEEESATKEAEEEAPKEVEGEGEEEVKEGAEDVKADEW